MRSPEEKPSAESRAGDVAAASPQLAAEVVDRLKAAVEMGDVMQVQTIASEVKSTNAEMATVCDKLIQLAEDFDFDGMQAFLDDLIQK